MKRLLAALLAAFLLLSVAACGEGAQNTADPGPAQVGSAEPALPAEGETPPPTEAEPAPVPEPEPVLSPREQTVGDLLSAMTTEEKVGQLFFVRCPDTAAAELTAQYHLGGLLLFGRDFKDGTDNWLTAEQFTATVQSYQEAAAIPLLIGVDEEGGTVARASRNPNLFARKRRSPQKVYAAGGAAAIAEDAAFYSRGLLELGINVNFAPVADVSTDPGDFIYSRTLGQDAAATAAYVTTAVETMEEAGIGSVLKHFPGYGNNVDTHTGIALDQRDYATFQAEDFLPFAAGIAAAQGTAAVLVSHNIVTAMDADLPASLSPAVHRILREELQFDGVILTDDLAMDAVEAYAEDGSVAVLAVLAGNDMIVTTDFTRQIPLVIAAVEDGTIPMELVDAAVSRVLAWKYDLGLI